MRVNDDGSVTLVVGYEAWPFPIPLVKTDTGWRFNTDAGFEEVLKRRIGENELTAIATLRAYVAAQRQYAAQPRDGTEVRQFAQKLQSAPGKKDGLYWVANYKAKNPVPAVLKSRTRRRRMPVTISKSSPLKARRLPEANTTTSSTVT